jgi:nucleoside-diphosphate-sugar epimerase
MQTTVLIAGGGSSIGKVLVEEFVHRGHDVRATYCDHPRGTGGRSRGRADGHPSEALDVELDAEVDWYSVDWSAVAADDAPSGEAVEAVEGARIIVDATQWSRSVPVGLDDALRASVSATRSVLSLGESHRAGRVIHVADPLVLGPASTSGGDTDGLSESDEYVPGTAGSWPPAEAAYAAQMEAYRFVQRGAPVVMAIPGMVVAPGCDGTTLGRLLARLWRAELSVTTGEQINVVDGRDVAASVAALATQGRPGRRFVLGGHNISVRDVVEMAAEIGGVERLGRHVPTQIVEQMGAAADTVVGGVSSVVGDGPRWPSAVLDKVGAVQDAAEAWVRDLRRLARAAPLSNDRAVNELNHRTRPLRRTLNDSFERFEANHLTGP